MVLNRAAKIPSHAPLNSMDYDSFSDFWESVWVWQQNSKHIAGDWVLLLHEHIRHGFEDKSSETFLGTSRTVCVPTSLQRRTLSWVQ